MVASLYAAVNLQFSSRVIDREICTARPDAIDFSIQLARGRFTGLIQSEPDARRAAINCQDAGHDRFHGLGPPLKRELLGRWVRNLQQIAALANIKALRQTNTVALSRAFVNVPAEKVARLDALHPRPQS